MFTNYIVVCSDGSIGLAGELILKPGDPAINWYYVVQFGPDGPFTEYKSIELRYATRKEIREAGLEGVGCNAPPR
jgi:hypothetical protein